MTDKQLENSNLEPVVPETPETQENTEIPAEQLEEVAGDVGPGWNTYRDYYGVYCKKCHNIFYAYDGAALQKLVTNPCRWCGAPYTDMIIDPSLSPRNKPDGPCISRRADSARRCGEGSGPSPHFFSAD